MLNEKEFKKIIQLSKLKIENKEEKEKLFKDLASILSYFEELKTLDTENVPPFNESKEISNFNLRTDEIKDDLNKEIALEEFPIKEDGYLVVPKVFED